MIREFNYKITKEYKSILEYLYEQGFSHSVVVHLKKTPESILKNGIWSYVREPLLPGDTLEIKIIETEGSPKIPPVDVPFELIYEDEDILVVNKPADTPIHPSLNNYENTLANGIMYYYAKQGIPYTFRCITRLDRDTTGLALLAKNMLSGGILSVAMQKHEITKHYYALVRGMIEEAGTVCAPIARELDSAITRCVDFERGDHAITHYAPVAYGKDMTLLKLNLETGRTHQIRVHMKYIGHGLLGDSLYHPEDTRMARQALHCCELDFLHPITRKPMHFSLDLPEDMRNCLASQ